MNVLVTGGCGFIGSHACEYYVKKGAKVIAYDNLTKYELERTGYSVVRARTFNLDFLKNLGVEILQQDIRDIDNLKLASRGCDFIINTAAQPAMTISWED